MVHRADSDKVFASTFKSLDAHTQIEFWKSVGRENLTTADLKAMMKSVISKYHKREEVIEEAYIAASPNQSQACSSSRLHAQHFV